MFRQYDSDNTVWSPQGRLFQIEYATEAVKKGSACVGLRSATHAVLAGLKQVRSPLASYQEKVFALDEHLGVAISGLTADARVLSQYMRRESMNYRFVFEGSLPLNRLVTQLSDKAQVHTQRYGRRPYGVGFLIAGYDKTGPHIYETCPSGNFFEYKAMAIGSRSQACKTYLEKTFEEYETASRNELIKHALTALREAIGSSSEGLTVQNVALGVVGPDEHFHIIDGEELAAFVAEFDGDNGARDTDGQDDDSAAASSMDV